MFLFVKVNSEKKLIKLDRYALGILFHSLWSLQWILSTNYIIKKCEKKHHGRRIKLKNCTALSLIFDDNTNVHFWGVWYISFVLTTNKKKSADSLHVQLKILMRPGITILLWLLLARNIVFLDFVSILYCKLKKKKTTFFYQI